MNRETKRALQRAKVQPLTPPDGAGGAGQAAMMAALLEAQKGGCECRPCKLLRRVAGDLTDSLIPEEEEAAL